MVQPPIMFIYSESRSDLQVTIINGNQKLLSKTNKKPKWKETQARLSPKNSITF